QFKLVPCLLDVFINHLSIRYNHALLITLISTQMSTHTNILMTSSSNGTVSDASNAIIANNQVTIERGKTVAGSAFNPAPVTALLSQRAIQLAGGSLPHENRQLYISMKKFYSSALIGFLLLFAFQGVRGQTTIEFNDV